MIAMNQAQNDEGAASHGYRQLFNLVYCSRAAAGVDDAAVERIIATAKRWNPQQGITGLLVVGSGIFFQWLEGPRDNVTHLMGLIAADPRHQNIVPLSETEEVRERLFPDWDMELVTSDDIRDVLVDAMETAKEDKHKQALSQLLHELDSGQLSSLNQA